MKNNLEDFIQANRSAFDDKQPSDSVWHRIRTELFGSETSGSGLIYWRAAAILFMGLSAFLLFSKFSETRHDKLVMNEFEDVESFYVREIDNKVEIIKTINGSEAVLNGFTHDFNQLEAMYEVLKDQMKTNPSKQVQDALVLNLLIRIDLLNKQLEKFEARREKERKEVKTDVSA